MPAAHAGAQNASKLQMFLNGPMQYGHNDRRKAQENADAEL